MVYIPLNRIQINKWLLLVALVVNSCCSSSKAQEHCTYETGFAHCPDFSIVAIHFVGDFTLLAIEADGGISGFPVFLKSVENQPALELVTWKERFPLLDAKGIGFYPQVTAVPPGSKKRFLFYFNRLPDEVTSFDLVELHKPLSEGFNFDEIRLFRRQKEEASCRFFAREDFEAHFECCKTNHKEGFYVLEVKQDSEGSERILYRDTIALVQEDGILRFYRLNGHFHYLEWNFAKQKLVFRDKFYRVPPHSTTENDGIVEVKNIRLNKRFQSLTGWGSSKLNLAFKPILLESSTSIILPKN